jgi:hypothetical protein
MDPTMLLGIAVCSVLLAAALGVVLGRYVWPTTPVIAQNELVRREQERERADNIRLAEPLSFQMPRNLKTFPKE